MVWDQGLKIIAYRHRFILRDTVDQVLGLITHRGVCNEIIIIIIIMIMRLNEIVR